MGQADLHEDVPFRINRIRKRSGSQRLSRKARQRIQVFLLVLLAIVIAGVVGSLFGIVGNMIFH
jgi:hypothetical protein